MPVKKIRENSQKYPEKKDDKNMRADMHMIRFEMLIDEVGKKLDYCWDKKYDGMSFPLLNFFFDPRKFNPYAKMIYDKSLHELSIDFSDFSHILGYNTTVVPRINKYGEYDIRSMARSMNFFVKNYNYRDQYKKIYELLFWSFMILTVDDSQRDEALARLSDFITRINNLDSTQQGGIRGLAKGIVLINPDSVPDSVFNQTNILYFISVIIANDINKFTLQECS